MLEQSLNNITSKDPKNETLTAGCRSLDPKSEAHSSERPGVNLSDHRCIFRKTRTEQKPEKLSQLERAEGYKFTRRSSVKSDEERWQPPPSDASTERGWKEWFAATLGNMGISLECFRKGLFPQAKQYVQLFLIGNEIKSFKARYEKAANHDNYQSISFFLDWHYEETVRQLQRKDNSDLIDKKISMLNECISHLKNETWESPTLGEAGTNSHSHEHQEGSLRLMSVPEPTVLNAPKKWPVISKHFIIVNDFFMYEEKIKCLFSIFQENGAEAKAQHVVAFNEKIKDIKNMLSDINEFLVHEDYASADIPLSYVDKAVENLKEFEQQTKEILRKQQEDQMDNIKAKGSTIYGEICKLMQEKFGQSKEDLEPEWQSFKEIPEKFANLLAIAEKLISDGNHVDAGKVLDRLSESIDDLKCRKCLLYAGKEPEAVGLLTYAYQVRPYNRTDPFDNPEVEKIFQDTIDARKPDQPYGKPGSSKSS